MVMIKQFPVRIVWQKEKITEIVITMPTDLVDEYVKDGFIFIENRGKNEQNENHTD